MYRVAEYRIRFLRLVSFGPPASNLHPPRATDPFPPASIAGNQIRGSIGDQTRGKPLFNLSLLLPSLLLLPSSPSLERGVIYICKLGRYRRGLPQHDPSTGNRHWRRAGSYCELSVVPSCGTIANREFPFPGNRSNCNARHLTE